MRGDVVVKVALAFVLDVESEDVVREVFPPRSALDQGVGVLQDVDDAVFEVGDAVGVRVPELDVVVARFSDGAVEDWEVVFGDVSVVAPTAELVTVVHRDCEFDVYGDVSVESLNASKLLLLPRA